jgi:HD superfamily phosphohydrolase
MTSVMSGYSSEQDEVGPQVAIIASVMVKKPSASVVPEVASSTLTPERVVPLSAPSGDPDFMQELFLPIHGHVELHREELAVIDHPSFQRLRRVRQLGLAHMVFPGATHTRFEHCVGAVHVAQTIVDHVNRNFKNAKNDSMQWRMCGIDPAAARFIRLGALLHDVGHLPFGHTLEDELNHLRSHDGPERLDRVATIAYPNHDVDRTVVDVSSKPSGGWTLKALIDKLYGSTAKELGLGGYDAFAILSQIVCKPPKKEPGRAEWSTISENLAKSFPLRVCQDIVGNTICADFLDYLHRDWYHLGKPLYFDERLYQYMEVRQRLSPVNGDAAPRFVINVRASEKIRHDALTDILELLNARYKLAETVLFHRTKLALTGLLDRCLLEVGDLYEQVGLTFEKLAESAESLLLEASDDGLPLLLKDLANGVDKSDRTIIQGAIDEETREIQAAVTQQTSFEEGAHRGKLGSQRDLALRLIDRLRDREVYTLACKLRMADFPGVHGPNNSRLQKVLEIYRVPKNRLAYLRMMEARCGLPWGSLVMNCPPDATMNAKVAKVNLFVEDEVSPFDKYEEQGEANLTRGALTAQIKRFYELWAAIIYIDRRVWDALSEGERKNLRSVLKTFFFPEQGADPSVVRAQMEPSLDILSNRKASRSGTTNVDEEQYRGKFFPSGLPFDKPSTK